MFLVEKGGVAFPFPRVLSPRAAVGPAETEWGNYTSPQSCALRGQMGKVAGGLSPGTAGDAGLGIRHSFHEQVEVVCLSEGWRRWEHLEGGQDCLAWHGLGGGHSWRGGGVLLQGRALGEVPAEQLSGISLVKSSQALLLLLLLIQQM